MPEMIRKIIYVLDGTPAECGNYERGQSLVELALMVPLLIMMLVGLVEIGWFTNNYLILLEVTRVSARYGTTLSGDTSPISWEMDVYDGMTNANLSVPAGGGADSQNYRNCDDNTYVGFYKEVTCLALEAMDPLQLDTDTGLQDDIVVSVFSINLVPGKSTVTALGNSAASSHYNSLYLPYSSRGGQTIDFQNSAPRGAGADSPQMMVTGRYPAGANECEGGGDIRDPFDINGNGTLDNFEQDSLRRDIYTSGGQLYDSGIDPQRGYAYTGNWVHASGCRGSAFSSSRMEATINLNNTGLSAEQMEFLPPTQGMILVEINWHHNLLLNLPAFSPVFEVLGGENGSYIVVWAAFPIPSAEFSLDLTTPD